MPLLHLIVSIKNQLHSEDVALFAGGYVNTKTPSTCIRLIELKQLSWHFLTAIRLTKERREFLDKTLSLKPVTHIIIFTQIISLVILPLARGRQCCQLVDGE